MRGGSWQNVALAMFAAIIIASGLVVLHQYSAGSATSATSPPAQPVASVTPSAQPSNTPSAVRHKQHAKQPLQDAQKRKPRHHVAPVATATPIYTPPPAPTSTPAPAPTLSSGLGHGSGGYQGPLLP